MDINKDYALTDVKNQRLASLLRQKQRDKQELKEMKFRLEREIKANAMLTQECG